MALSVRRKLTIISLLIYWPAIFYLAHRPVPGWVSEAQVSDKSLHFLAYLVLVFLLWSAIGRGKKVNWRKAVTWWILFVVVWYGVIDELLQGYMGRTCAVSDFVANLAGALTGLVLFTFFTFWTVLLVVTGITVFLLTNLTRVNLSDLLPVTSVMFYLLAYGFFTMLWIRYMHLFLSLKAPQLKWLIGALFLPTGLLLTVKLFSVILGKDFRARNVLISAIGIAAVVITVFLTALFRRWHTQKLSPGNFKRSV